MKKIFQSDFERIFFKREFRSLAGRRNARLWQLFFIFVTTFLALGYAVGGRKLLQKRMDNPYTNWVDITITSDNRDTIDAIRRYFSRPEHLDPFLLKGISDHVMILDKIYVDQKTGTPIELKGRSISPDDAILSPILSPDEGNHLSGLTPDASGQVRFSSPLGIIITREALEKLGYTEVESQRLVFARFDAVEVLMPVEAVVKELPNFCDYCFTPAFYNLFHSNYLDTRFVPVERSAVNQFHVVSDQSDSLQMAAWWTSACPELPLAELQKTPLVLNEARRHFRYQFTLRDYPTPADLDRNIKKLQEKASAEGYRCQMVFEPNPTAGTDAIARPHNLSFHFERLKEIDAFKDLLRRQFGVDINLAQVASKKNFVIVSAITALLAFLLLISSLLGIYFFIDSLLKSHIEAIKPNLGAFLAFGLSNADLVRAYTRILGAFMLIGAGAALLVAALFEVLEAQWTDRSRFDLLNGEIALALLALLLAGMLKSVYTIRGMLRNTPGNLIYEREH